MFAARILRKSAATKSAGEQNLGAGLPLVSRARQSVDCIGCASNPYRRAPPSLAKWIGYRGVCSLIEASNCGAGQKHGCYTELANLLERMAMKVFDRHPCSD